MDGVATLPPADRQALFTETAYRRGMAPIIVEKDFWVCWTLKQLFSLPEIASHMIFKGGTSLSKVFGAIERFSEDIDVSLNREWLGFTGDHDPEQASSKKKAARLVTQLQNACRDKVKEELMPALYASFASVLGPADLEDSAWQVIQDDQDLQQVFFAYPSPLDPTGTLQLDYIRPVIKIEVGARSDHWPAGEYSIVPYAAEEFPDLFTKPTCKVKVLEAERTFWEKATILHAEYHRPQASTGPDRISRHYYDLYRLAKTKIADQALARLDLLKRVAEHKSVFFPAAWAMYDEAKPGTLRLLPHAGKLGALRRDYEKMKIMFFGENPSFDDILKELSDLEVRVNRPATSASPKN